MPGEGNAPGRPPGSYSTNARRNQNKLDRPIEELPDPPAHLNEHGVEFYHRFGGQLVEDKILSARDMEAFIVLCEAYELTKHEKLTPAQRFKLKKEFINAMKPFGAVPSSRRQLQSSRKEDPGSLIPDKLKIVPREA